MFFFSQKTVTKAILFGNVNRRKKQTLLETLSIVSTLAFWANDPYQLKFLLWKNRF